MPHRYLERQLKKLHLSAERAPDLSGWQKFLAMVSEAYETFDRERKLIERSLELSSKEIQERWDSMQANQRLQNAILAASLGAIVLIDANGYITEFNLAAEKMFGYERKDVLGASFLEKLFPEALRSQVTHEFAEIMENRVPKRIELQSVRANGDEFSIELSAAPVPVEERFLISMYIRDLSEQKQMTRKLEEQQAIVVTSSKMAALGEMAGGIAHEINNPLAVINSLSSQLEEIMQEPEIDRELVKEMTVEIVKTTDRIAKIVNGLRSFSRDGSRDPLVPTNVKQVIDDTLSLCRERFYSSQVRIDVSDFDPTLVISARAVEVSQVLLNLLSNAHHEIAGFQDKWIKVDVRKNSDSVEVAVIDCGPGIPAEVQRKLFQPFFTTKEVGKGTGLGLSISRKILENHGGSLRYETAQNHTCFVLKFPILEKNITKDLSHAS